MGCTQLTMRFLWNKQPGQRILILCCTFKWLFVTPISTHELKAAWESMGGAKSFPMKCALMHKKLLPSIFWVLPLWNKTKPGLKEAILMYAYSLFHLAIRNSSFPILKPSLLWLGKNDVCKTKILVDDSSRPSNKTRITLKNVSVNLKACSDIKC